MKSTSLIPLLALASANEITIGVFSDLHMKEDYFPFYKSNGCTMTSAAEQEGVKQGKFLSDDYQIALLGRLGCDAPPKLVKYVLELFK